MKRRLSLLLLIFSVIICGTNNITVFADSKGQGKPPKSVCIEESEKQWKEFNNRVLKDIVKTYNLDLVAYQEFTHRDLDLNVGDNLNDHPDKISLQHLFIGTSIGTMRLFLKDGLEGKEGYFLYKRIDGNNVLKKLHKIGNVWVVSEVNEQKGKGLHLKPYNWDKCNEN
ncbi:hypothetical protein [Neobacillus drentensis]|uniref:hypothetical protein n=1 Tax=Neobacillus drentensis TaxID=220684 RepID=UPI0028643502|nr:hypothetical protein [Neobacillus drentensis]MDR7240482.1 oligoribonuclease (3'-5' exoribonuclease) [Neobacillus drentensis]